MVLPSVFPRCWDHFGRKMTPPGGVPETPFWGSGGDPPHPPGRGGGGGGPPQPPGGVPPPPEGGETPAKKDPPLGPPFLQPNSCKEITRGEARYRFSTHSPVPCQR